MVWDPRYATEEYVYGTDPSAFLADTVAGLQPPGRVLCLAEGEGRAQSGPSSVGTDLKSVCASAPTVGAKTTAFGG